MSAIPFTDHAQWLAPLGDRVVVPSDPAYASCCSGFNLSLTKQPEVVVMACSTSDVVAAVTYAAATGMKISVQATGHGSGLVARHGMLINTSRMQSLQVDPVRRTATVGAGVKWRQVIDAAAPYGLAPLCGSSPNVGVVGLTLGGGMGPMGRTFGFAADHVRRLELVTADSAVLDVTPESEPELFWALRGGKCSVGIVTEIEFELMEVPDYYGGAIYYPGHAAGALLHAFRTWAPTLPGEATTSVALLRLPDVDGVPAPLRGQFCVSLRYVFVGEDQQGEQLLAPMRAVAEPIVDLVGRTPYAAIGSVHQDPDQPLPAWDRGMLLRELPFAAVEALLQLAGPDVDVPLIMVELRLLGGALAKEQGLPDAVGGRDASVAVTVVGPYPEPLRQAVTGAGAAVLAALEPWGTGGTQINFQGDATTEEEVSRAWPVEAWQRLQELKRSRDPQGRFSFGYGV